MHRKIGALLAAFALMLGVGLTNAMPASAAQRSCVAGNYGYASTANWSYGGGNVTFNNWSITGSLPMEYRVRWLSPNGTAIYDTGYVAWQPTNPSGYPNVRRYTTANTTILINAGKYGDGVATCSMTYTVPPSA